jgi:signal peptidase I
LKGKSTESGHRRLRESKFLRELLSLIIKIAVIAAIGTAALTFVYGFHRGVEPGMAPAFKSEDVAIFYRWDKDYRVGDVLLLAFRGEKQVRRVVAVEGDTVDITQDGLVVNGAIQQEPEIYEDTERYVEGASLPLTLGKGEVFVLGDARKNAEDSRVYGAVNGKDTFGKVLTVIRRKNI